MSEQPDVRWAPIPPKPSNRRKAWLIAAIVAAAIVIAGLLVWMLFPRGGGADPVASDTPSPGSSETAVPSSTPTDLPTAPVTTPPAVPDPSVDTFRDQVSGWLNDAPRGLDIVADSTPEEAVSVIETLQQDAQRLWDAQPPSSIGDQWRDGVTDYSVKLDALRSAATGGSVSADAVEAARSAVNGLRALVGL